MLDGEIIALQDDRPARFQVLQERFREQADVERKSESTPAALVAFDLLGEGGDLLIAQPWTERRKQLEARLSWTRPTTRTPEMSRARPRVRRGKVRSGMQPNCPSAVAEWVYSEGG